MENRNSNNFINNSRLHKESDSNKSFVKKVKSHVSGLLSSSLGKWFTSDHTNKSVVRHREDEDDEECFNIEPPVKRVKMPSPELTHISYNMASTHNQNHFSIEPTAGPSGIQSKKQHIPTIYNSNHLLNCDKDSDVSDSELSLSKLKSPTVINSDASPFGGHSRTLFSDRSLTPQLNTSLSSRRPSFNSSTFGSPNFVDRTLSTKRILNSPFYKGRTIYGGASAYSSRQSRVTEPMAHKNQIQVKPVNEAVCGNDASLSKTARRILHALEEFRSPISDAKKVPPPVNRRPEGMLTKYTGANPYLNREHKIPLALNKELQVPTVPDLLKMKLKERLQDSTVAVRQIATNSKSVLNKDDYRIRASEEDTPKHSNKMKTKITSTRQQKNNNQNAEEVKLPEIPLPITTLPKFDFSLPPPPSSCKQPLITVACNNPPKIAEPFKKKQEVINVDLEEMQFKFSNPLVLAENLVSIIAINDFKFSDPVFKQKERSAPDVSVNFKSSSIDSIPLKRKVQNVELPQPAVKLAKTSIDELFNKTNKESLDKFKPAADMWECSVCLIRNKPEQSKCAACETPKPSLNTIQKASSTTSNSITNTVSTFGDKFKPPASTWECPSCMIRNKDEIEKCIACETAKPQSKNDVSTFGDAFKKKETEWECPICMIRNRDDKSTCLACETPKPGSKPSKQDKKQENIPTFNFGILPTTPLSNVKETAVLPLSSATVATTTAPSLPVFSFGIPQKTTTSSEVPKKDALPEVVTPVSKKPELHLPKPLEEVKVVEHPAPEKKPEEPLKPIEELTKPAALPSGGFSFGNFAKPAAEVKTIPTSLTKPIETIKPILTSPARSAFSFTPTASAPSLKRAANDSENSTPIKKDSTSIIFSPPKADLLVKDVAAAPQTNMFNQPDKNLFNIEKPTVLTQQPPATTTSNTFAFSAPQTQPPATTAPPLNLFNFGAKTTAAPLFGNMVTTTQAPIFKFPQPEREHNMFINSPAPSIFGTPKPAFDTPPPAGSFGTVSQTGFNTEVKQPPTFGTEQKATPLPFGATDTKPFSFGAPVRPTEDVAKPPMFSFGPSVKAQEPQKPFSFGAPTAAPPLPAPTDGFSFNSSSPPAPTFNFNAPKAENTLPFQSPPAASNIFNAAPLQHQQPIQNGGFNFGSISNPNNNVKTGFNFGTTHQFNSPPAPAPTAPNAGIFSFGSGSNPNMPQPTGGFNFGQTPAPAFNANSKPNFNFTAGNPTGFSATPDSPQVAQRRRLKAVRRNQR